MNGENRDDGDYIRLLVGTITVVVTINYNLSNSSMFFSTLLNFCFPKL